MDIFGGIEISSKVLIHPNINTTNKRLPDGFERGDSFVSKRNKEIDNVGFFKAITLLSKAYSIKKAKEKYEKNSFWGCSRYPACRYTQ